MRAMITAKLERKEVPPRALALSGAALAVPVLAAFTAELPHEYELLLWLVALVPAFLLAYYKGWTGVAIAMAAGMAVIATANAVLVWMGQEIEATPFLFGVIVAYVGIGVGVGISSELLHRAREEAAANAMLDPMTGLGNRRFAEGVMGREFAAAQRGRPVCFVLFDLDAFKELNDTYGHAAGDAVLHAFGEVLQTNTRAMNVSARLGGDEFISILSGSEIHGAQVFARRVLERFRQRPSPYGPHLASAGVAAYDDTMKNPRDLYEAADQALYRAKALGPGNLSVFGGSALEDSAVSHYRPHQSGSADEHQSLE